MYQNSCCCPPPTHKRDDCCCKDGMLCALDWFYQDFLLAGQRQITDLKYYPELISPPNIPNTITNIPYITPDIVPVYTDSYNPTMPYNGDITYLNICKLHGFEFKFNTTTCPIINTCPTTKENDIKNRFSKIRYTSSKGCCCKNGVLEYLLIARDSLVGSSDSVILSTSAKSFKVTQILAINSDTVWAKNVDGSTTTYYVLSLCEIIGITLDKTPPLVTP